MNQLFQNKNVSRDYIEKRKPFTFWKSTFLANNERKFQFEKWNFFE